MTYDQFSILCVLVIVVAFVVDWRLCCRLREQDERIGSLELEVYPSETDLRAQARDRLGNWWARRKSSSFFNHM